MHFESSYCTPREDKQSAKQEPASPERGAPQKTSPVRRDLMMTHFGGDSGNRHRACLNAERGIFRRTGGILIAGFNQSKKKILIMKHASLDWNLNSFSQEWNLTRIFTLAWDWCHFHGNTWTPPNTNLLRISEHHMEEKAIRFLHYCKFGITSLKKSYSADVS